MAEMTCPLSGIPEREGAMVGVIIFCAGTHEEMGLALDWDKLGEAWGLVWLVGWRFRDERLRYCGCCCSPGQWGGVK